MLYIRFLYMTMKYVNYITYVGSKTVNKGFIHWKYWCISKMFGASSNSRFFQIFF